MIYVIPLWIPVPDSSPELHLSVSLCQGKLELQGTGKVPNIVFRDALQEDYTSVKNFPIDFIHLIKYK